MLEMSHGDRNEPHAVQSSQDPGLGWVLHTGGEGGFTQWVWVELIESTETICPANTHQVCAEFI